MTIHEPATLATDYALAAVAAWLAGRLHPHAPSADSAARWWVRALTLTAVSAFVGGSYHGFALNLPAFVSRLWWLFTLWNVSLVGFAVAVAWTYEVIRPRWHQLALAIVAAKFLAFAALAVIRPSFAVVVLDYGSSILLWLGAALLLRRAWSAWMLAAIALSLVAALVQQLRLAPAPWFNHNDLYHLIQAFGLVAFYRAALKLIPSVP